MGDESGEEVGGDLDGLDLLRKARVDDDYRPVDETGRALAFEQDRADETAASLPSPIQAPHPNSPGEAPGIPAPA